MSLPRYNKSLYFVFCNTYYPMICTSKESAMKCLSNVQDNFTRSYTAFGQVSFRFIDYIDKTLGVSGLRLLVFINNNLIDADDKLYLGYLCFKNGFGDIEGSQFQFYMKSGNEWSKYRMLFSDDDLSKSFKTLKKFKDLRAGKLDSTYVDFVDGSNVVIKSTSISGNSGFNVDLSNPVMKNSLGDSSKIVGIDYSTGISNRIMIQDVNYNNVIV